MLGLENEVRLIEKDFERNELIRYIQEADCGLIAYTNRIHGSSGIIPLILSAGRAVISTPIEYSVHTQKVTKGLVVANGFDVDDFVEKLEELASNIDRWRARLPEIYMETRGWLWQASGSKYRATFREALDVVE